MKFFKTILIAFALISTPAAAQEALPVDNPPPVESTNQPARYEWCEPRVAYYMQLVKRPANETGFEYTTAWNNEMSNCTQDPPAWAAVYVESAPQLEAERRGQNN